MNFKQLMETQHTYQRQLKKFEKKHASIDKETEKIKSKNNKRVDTFGKNNSIFKKNDMFKCKDGTIFTIQDITLYDTFVEPPTTKKDIIDHIVYTIKYKYRKKTETIYTSGLVNAIKLKNIAQIRAYEEGIRNTQKIIKVVLTKEPNGLLLIVNDQMAFKGTCRYGRDAMHNSISIEQPGAFSNSFSICPIWKLKSNYSTYVIENVTLITDNIIIMNALL